MRIKRGFIVAFEGIDGSGKTTQARLLHDRLKKRGLDVVLTREPTDSTYGLKIKKLAREGRDINNPSEEYRLFLSDRRIHVEDLIRPALAENQIVVVDRYYFSSIAYQGALGMDPETIRSENESFAPVPEVVILLKVAPRVGLRRIEKKRKEVPNLFEREDYLAAVNEVYDSLKQSYIVRLNGVGEMDFIHGQVMNVIDDIVNHYLEKEELYSLPNRNNSSIRSR